MQNAANAVAALAKVSPNLFVASLQDGIVRLLESPEFASATRFEVGVMNTPEGELYDRSILESSVKYEVQTHNIKRESKLYSYKEQMEEMELRKVRTEHFSGCTIPSKFCDPPPPRSCNRRARRSRRPSLRPRS